MDGSQKSISKLNSRVPSSVLETQPDPGKQLHGPRIIAASDGSIILWETVDKYSGIITYSMESRNETLIEYQQCITWYKFHLRKNVIIPCSAHESTESVSQLLTRVMPEQKLRQTASWGTSRESWWTIMEHEKSFKRTPPGHIMHHQHWWLPAW